MVNKSEEENSFNQNEMRLLQSFATFASVSFENSRLKDLASPTLKVSEFPKYISEKDHDGFKILRKLTLPRDKQEETSSLAFFAIDLQRMREIKLFFFLFSKFHLLEKFKVSNEMFFDTYLSYGVNITMCHIIIKFMQVMLLSTLHMNCRRQIWLIF
jgi:hypothetical protein